MSLMNIGLQSFVPYLFQNKYCDCAFRDSRDLPIALTTYHFVGRCLLTFYNMEEMNYSFIVYGFLSLMICRKSFREKDGDYTVLSKTRRLRICDIAAD